MALSVKSFTFGLFQVHNYLIWEDTNQQAILFDAGNHPQPVLDFIEANELTLTHLLLTHAHIDHVEGWELLKTALPQLEIWGHETASFWLDQLQMQANMFGMVTPKRPLLTKTLSHKDQLKLLNGLTIEVRHAPGHAPESLCYWMPELNSCVVGDVIFYRSIGRTDFPRGDYNTLIHSIETQVLSLPASAILYSGHGPTTTVEQEKQANPFLLKP